MIQSRAQAEEVIFGNQTFGDGGLPASQTATNAAAVGVLNSSTTAPNVIVNGWKTENNKGAVIEQWEPYYDQGWDFVKPSQAQYGQKVTMYYDSIGRAVRTVNPDGTEQRVITGIPSALNVLTNFTPSPWESYTYDANDLAPITPSNSSTANVAAGHYYTPRSVKIDALGRMIESTDRNYKNSAVEEVRMQYFYDIRGNTLRVDDAIKVDVNTSRDSAFLHVYDYANQPLKTTHIDKGTSTVFINAAGIPLETRDAKGALVLSSFDELLRPVKMWAQDKAGELVTLRQKVVYGDSAGLSNPEIKNLLGMPYKNYDEAGLVIVPEYDFKGQPITKTRKVIKDSKIVNAMPTTYRADWDILDENTDLEGEYVTDMDYDGIGRPVTITLPKDVSGGRKLVVPSYNRSGGMESIKLDGQIFVSRIAYNAKGQKVLMVYGNDLMTRYAYDAVNFRLLRQVTENFTLTGLTYTPGSGSKKQDCSYEYDLSGNITKMTDATAASGVAGAASLDRLFEYDALYRLVQATGRESGQYSNYSSPQTEPHVPDNRASNTRAYTRNYEYDRLGNILKLNHNAGVGNTFNRWFNDFQNNAAAFQLSNLATETSYGSTTINYGFDANGNQISEGSSRSFEWDYGDRMRGFAEGTSVRAAYLYDTGGQRVKKIVTKSTGNTEVTVYIDGGFEYLYELDSSGTKDEEFNEFHVMDDRSRIARVKVFGSTWSGSTADEVRYNLEDHLGNAGFTLNDAGSLITREEYFPFGDTSFGSFAKKRYRFCGKERDEESGLYYYGARYYAAWTCRFVSVDPLAREYPFYTPYQYAGNQPINSVDLDGLEKDPESDTGPQKNAPDNNRSSGSNNSETKNTTSDQNRKNDLAENLTPEVMIYQVQKGETLGSISKSHTGVSVSQLSQWNDDLTKVEEGQFLVVSQPPDSWKNDDAMKFWGLGQGIVSLMQATTESSGILGKNAQSLLKVHNEGFFMMKLADGTLLKYKMGFKAGSKFRLTSDMVKAAKSAFLSEVEGATEMLRFVKGVKAAGVLLNYLGVGLAVANMAENGINGKNSLDLAFSGYAFVPGYGWIISGAYFLIDATIGIDTYFMYHNMGMQGWEENDKDPAGDGFYNTLKSMGD